MDKYLSFEYFLKGIWDWYYEAFPEKNQAENENDLSILKCLKLLFLATAAEVDEREKDSNDLLIEGTFNRFSALPLGHVESEIYSHIRGKQGVLTYFTLTREKLIRTNVDFHTDLAEVNTAGIDFSIHALRKRNPALIKMRAYELVDLTHKWASWRILYKKEHGSAPIPNNIIKSERKYFY